MRVGFIGLGTMGAIMAGNLAARGHQLVVYDVRAGSAEPLVDAGALAVQSPREVAAQADLVLTSLPGPAEVAEVAAGPEGILTGGSPGMVHLDLSTNSWPEVRGLAVRYRERELHFLDAPVSGGPSGAASRRLAVWVGGDEDAFARARPVLTDLADRVARVGDVGAGTVVKLVHNATGNAMNLLFAELFLLADTAGVDPLTLWRNVREGAVGRRRTYDGLAAHFLPQRYDPPALTLDLARKDTQLLVEMAGAVDASVPRMEEVLHRMDEAVAQGWGRRDSRVTMLQVQEAAQHLLPPIADEQIGAVYEADPPAGPDVRVPPTTDGR